MFLLWGPGDNGKSVLLQIIYRILGGTAGAGGYADTVSLDVLVEHDRRDSAGASPDLAKLAGARLAYVSETDDRRPLNTALIKRLTGHGDPIACRHLYQEPFRFVPRFKIWMTGNRKPRVRASDRATWARLRLIHFPVTIPKDRQDEHLVDRLIETEGPGILRWAVEGARWWSEAGLGLPEAVRAATEEYREEQDIIARFLSECYTADADARVFRDEIYIRYREWATANEDRPVSKIAFGRLLAEAGVESGGGDGSRRSWKGYRPR